MICPRCGRHLSTHEAQNSAVAPMCWNCFERIDREAEERLRQAVSEHTLIHEAGGLPNRVRELLKPYEFLADDCGERVILKLDLDEAMELISGALEVAEAQSDGRGKALRYIAFVLAGDEQEDAQLAADRAKGELAALRALERELRSGKNVDGIVMALGVLDQVRRDLKR